MPLYGVAHIDSPALKDVQAMSALGHKRTCATQLAMSAKGQKRTCGLFDHIVSLVGTRRVSTTTGVGRL